MPLGSRSPPGVGRRQEDAQRPQAANGAAHAVIGVVLMKPVRRPECGHRIGPPPPCRGRRCTASTVLSAMIVMLLSNAYPSRRCGHPEPAIQEAIGGGISGDEPSKSSLGGSPCLSWGFYEARLTGCGHEMRDVFAAWWPPGEAIGTRQQVPLRSRCGRPRYCRHAMPSQMIRLSGLGDTGTATEARHPPPFLGQAHRGPDGHPPTPGTRCSGEASWAGGGQSRGTPATSGGLGADHRGRVRCHVTDRRGRCAPGSPPRSSARTSVDDTSKGDQPRTCRESCPADGAQVGGHLVAAISDAAAAHTGELGGRQAGSGTWYSM